MTSYNPINGHWAAFKPMTFVQQFFVENGVMKVLL